MARAGKRAGKQSPGHRTMRHGAAPAATTPREAQGSARGPGRRPDVRPGRQSGARPRACRHSRGSGTHRTSTAHTADGSSAPHARTPPRHASRLRGCGRAGPAGQRAPPRTSRSGTRGRPGRRRAWPWPPEAGDDRHFQVSLGTGGASLPLTEGGRQLWAAASA